MELMLLDSAHLQEEDARFANRHRTSRHDPARPLYTTEDATMALELIRRVPFDEELECLPDTTCSFRPNGHILGSSTIRVATDRTSVLFTGDVGRPVDRVMHAPAPPPPADVVVTESTYGNRLHDNSDPAEQLAAVVERTLGRGGTVLIPSFAVGRAQAILTLLSDLMDQDRVPRVPLHLNSPMAISATEIFIDHHALHRLSSAECERLRTDVDFSRTVEASKLLSSARGPRIVVTASGMATGGRVLHHLRQLAPDHRNSIVFVGFQAAGTRGDALVSGAREIKIFGDYTPVRADVEMIAGLSAHADHRELINWLKSGQLDPRHAYVVHGEASAADAFRRAIIDQLGWAASVPTQGVVAELDDVHPHRTT
jgi:metallo-beta-lactamase family protein